VVGRCYCSTRIRHLCQLVWLDVYRNQLFKPSVTPEISALFGRLFATWTIGSVFCVIALLIAPRNRALYYLNLVIFGNILVFMLGELTVFKTTKMLGSASVLFIAGFTFLYMLSRLITGAAFTSSGKSSHVIASSQHNSKKQL